MRRSYLTATPLVSSIALLAACSMSGTKREAPVEHMASAVIEDSAQYCDDEADEHATEEMTPEVAAAQAAAADVPAAWSDGTYSDGQHQLAQRVRILGLNDFHGQIMGPGAYGKTFTDAAKVVHPVGGAAVMSSWLKAAMASAPGGPSSVVITHSGDFVGASGPQSGLLRDEPAILWFNQLANDSCGYGSGSITANCNLVAAIGNHEFDRGQAELSRLIEGGNAATGPYVVPSYPGAKYPYIAANVIDNATGALVFRPYDIKNIRGERVAFIGAVTRTTPSAVTPAAIAGLSFTDEATAINKYIPEIQAKGIHAIVVLIHEGGSQNFGASTLVPVGAVAGPIGGIVAKLDVDVDVVVSGHSHNFTNAFLPNAGGKSTLVTQSFSYSAGFGQIDLEIDTNTHDIIGKVGKIQIAYADSGPGLTPDAAAKALVDDAVAATGPKVNEVLGNTPVALIGPRSTGGKNFAGETNLGDLIADAQRTRAGGTIALMNPGGIRADIGAGSITWGQLYAVQPFANNLVTETLTGAQLWSTLAEQWTNGNKATGMKILQISGLSYAYHCTASCASTSATTPPLFAIDWVKDAAGVAIPNDATLSYIVVVNSFLASGGDNFPTLAKGTGKTVRMVDLDALVDYVRAKVTVGAPTDTRITRGPNPL